MGAGYLGMRGIIAFKEPGRNYTKFCLKVCKRCGKHKNNLYMRGIRLFAMFHVLGCDR